MTQKQKRSLLRIIITILFLIAAQAVSALALFPEGVTDYAHLALFLVPYLIIGMPVLLRAGKNIFHGNVLDENFLMSIATIGAFFLQQYPEAVAVMLFYQIGEFFESYAIGKSRKSIAALMEIRPEFANVERAGVLVQVDPDEVRLDDIIVIKPGERVPLDGVVIKGASRVDTAALTGESVPKKVEVDDAVISGTVNLSGLLNVRVTKAYGDSTVARILELVENASEKKAKTESFITRFARFYTPIVVGLAVLLAVFPPLFFAQPWASWIERGLIFLVVSCPCALVISVPLSFFGGIGGASRQGILIKGSNYLEALAKAETIVFDKTGTLTHGTFSVVAVHPHEISESVLLELSAHAEGYSNHPIAVSIRLAHKHALDLGRVAEVKELPGFGISAHVDGRRVSVGNMRLMEREDIEYASCETTGTVIHVAVDGVYAGHIIISDVIKPDAREAIRSLKTLGIKKTIMLTGDHREAAVDIAQELRLDEYYAELLPQDKVNLLEKMLQEKEPKTSIAFVGDGVNDAPVLMRADIGIAMGAMGSDAAIEAADVVLMDDRPSKIVTAIAIARKTLRIVYQNIFFALGVKFAVLLLATFGLANMWLAVFADVGVSIIAILNAMRALRIKE